MIIDMKLSTKLLSFYNTNSKVRKGPVIIYDLGGAGSNEILREFFSWPTRRVERKIRQLLDVSQKKFDAYYYTTQYLLLQNGCTKCKGLKAI